MKGRFAPSPTGYMHLGNLWIALLSYLSARRQNGTFLIRIEDIDTQRSKPKYSEALLDDLEWLGFDWDEGPRAKGTSGPYFQSERIGLYASILGKWQQNGRVYPCSCKRSRLQQISSAPHEHENRPLYDGHCRHLPFYPNMLKPVAWRLRTEETSIGFNDIYQGFVSETLIPERDDFVLRRGDGLYSYQLAVAVDDGAMGVTEVIRGYDLLGSTAGQIYLHRLLANEEPKYGHATLLMDQAQHRLSKRQGGITIRTLRDTGMSPEEILGRLAFSVGLVKKMPTSIRSEKKHDWYPMSLADLQKNFDDSSAKQPHRILTNFDIKL